MRNVTQHFLSLCLPPLLLMPLRAQEMLPQIKGGGSVTLGGRRLGFLPAEAVAGKPQGGLSVKVLRLKGTFQDPKGERLDFELQFTQGGQIYRMNLARRAGGQEVERWAATMKTQVKVLQLEGRVGGTVRLKLSGPLSGIVAGLGRQDAWEGEIWYTLQSWPEK